MARGSFKLSSPNWHCEVQPIARNWKGIKSRPQQEFVLDIHKSRLYLLLN